jgi:iron-sulfur cluster repair protein YtfE (RIC family)
MSSRDTWRAHPNSSGPAAMLLGIHDQFRAAAAQLMRFVAQTNAPAIERLFAQLANVLHHHHHAEEDMLFPLVHRRTGTAPAQLQIDHDEMTAAISAVERAIETTLGVGDAIATFHDILLAHLDREEALVMPVLLEVPPHELWAELHS